MPEAVMLDVMPDDQLLNLSYISRQFRKIAVINGWQSYHTPKNLASAMTVEASELLAEFQWLTPEQSLGLSPNQKMRVANEVADVTMYLIELCESLGIDMVRAVQAKIEFNEQRFGVNT